MMTYIIYHSKDVKGAVGVRGILIILKLVLPCLKYSHSLEQSKRRGQGGRGGGERI